MKEKIPGIYCIENLINNKKYIGQSIDLNQRLRNHKSILRGISSDSIVLQRAWDLYGEENFSMYIIEKCPVEFLNDREKYWIKELKSHVSESGYNISFGGDAPMEGRHHTDYTKKILSDFFKGTAAWNKGIPCSEEWKRNLSESHKGKPSPMKGRKHKDVSKAKMSNSRRGRKISLESKLKMSKYRIGRKLNFNSTSKYVGVSYNKNSGKWESYYKCDGKRIHIGLFDSEIRAAEAYDIKIMEILECDMITNFQKDHVYTTVILDRNKSSKYRGVTKIINKNNNVTWSSGISFNKKQINLGIFDSEEDAALIYDKKSLEIYGENAFTNFDKNFVLSSPIPKKHEQYSKFSGISFSINENKWLSYISVDNKRQYLGYFQTELEAAIAYNEASLEFYGSKAKLNNISEEEFNNIMINS